MKKGVRILLLFITAFAVDPGLCQEPIDYAIEMNYFARATDWIVKFRLTAGNTAVECDIGRLEDTEVSEIKTMTCTADEDIRSFTASHNDVYDIRWFSNTGGSSESYAKFGWVRIKNPEQNQVCVRVCFNCIMTNKDNSPTSYFMADGYCYHTREKYRYKITITMGADGTKESIVVQLPRKYGSTIVLFKGPNEAYGQYTAEAYSDEYNEGPLYSLRVGSIPQHASYTSYDSSTFTAITISEDNEVFLDIVKDFCPYANCEIKSGTFSTFYATAASVDMYSVDLGVTDGLQVDRGRMFFDLDIGPGPEWTQNHIFQYTLPQFGLPEDRTGPVRYEFPGFASGVLESMRIHNMRLDVVMTLQEANDAVFIPYMMVNNDGDKPWTCYFIEPIALKEENRYTTGAATLLPHRCVDKTVPLYGYEVTIEMGDNALEETLVIKLQDTFGGALAFFHGRKEANTIYTAIAETDVPDKGYELEKISVKYLKYTNDASVRVININKISIKDSYENILTDDICNGQQCTATAAVWSDKFNQNRIDNCDGVVCENAFTCIDRVDSYECECQKGFSGTHCESNFPPCDTDIFPITGACYWLEKRKLGWEDAWMECHRKGGTLATVDSEVVFNKFLQTTELHPRYNQPVWIGASMLHTPAVYRWINGRTMEWTKFSPHLYDRTPSTRKHCLAWTTDGWLELECSDTYYFFCQTVPVDFYCKDDDPLCAPWIHQDFTTVLQNKECSSFDDYDTIVKLPANVECENLCRYASHIECRAAEDAVDHCTGTKKSQASMNTDNCLKDATGTTLHIRELASRHEASSVVYTMVTLDDNSGTWNEANEACKAQGYRLLTIKSQAKASQVGNVKSWLGLTDKDSPGVFRWLDGSLLIYNSWQAGSVDFTMDTNVAFASSSMWTQQDPEITKQFICEFFTADPCATVECKHGTCANELPTFKCTCDYMYGGLLCDQNLVFTLATIVLEVTYTDDHNDTSSTDAIAVFSKIETALPTYLRGQVDNFVSLKGIKIESYTNADHIVVYVNMTSTSYLHEFDAGTIINQYVTALQQLRDAGSIDGTYLEEDGGVGRWDDAAAAAYAITIFKPNLARKPVRTRAEGDVDKEIEISTHVSIRITEQYVAEYRNIKTSQAKQMKQKIESELHARLDTSLNDYISANVLFFSRENGHTVAHIDVITKSTMKTFDATAAGDKVQHAVDEIISDGLLGASSAPGAFNTLVTFTDAYPVNVRELKGVTVDMPKITDVKSKIEIYLSHAWNDEYQALTNAESVALAANVIDNDIMPELQTLNSMFHNVIMTRLRNIQSRVVMDLEISFHTSVASFNSTRMQEQINAALQAATSDEHLGIIEWDRQRPITIKEIHVECVIQVSLHLAKLKFIAPYVDDELDSDEAVLIVTPVEEELNRILHDSMHHDSMISVQVTQLRKKNGATLVVLDVRTREQLSTFNHTTLHSDAERGMHVVVSEGNVGGFEIESTLSVRRRPSERKESVSDELFVHATIRLDSKYIEAYDDLNSEEARELIVAVENEVSRIVESYMTNYMFTNVGALRDVGGKTVVELDVTAYAHHKAVDFHALYVAVSNAINAAAADGKVGGYSVLNQDYVALVVSDPRETDDEDYLTKVTIRLQEPYVEAFVDPESTESEAFMSPILNETRIVLETQLGTYFKSVTIVDIRGDSGETLVDFDITTTPVEMATHVEGYKDDIHTALMSIIDDNVLGGFALDHTGPDALVIDPNDYRKYTTTVTVMIDEELSMVYNATNSELTQIMVALVKKDVKGAVSKSNHVNGFSKAILLSLSSAKGKQTEIAMRVECISYAPLSALKTHIYKAMEELLGSRVLGGYFVEPSAAATVEKPYLDYVISLVKIPLSEAFEEPHKNISSADSAHMIGEFTGELDSILGGSTDYEGFHSTKVVNLMNVDNSITVILEVATEYKQNLNPIEVRAAIDNALSVHRNDPAGDQTIGGYALHPTDEHTVNRPVLGHATSQVTMNIALEFLPHFGDMSDAESELLINVVEKQINKIMTMAVPGFRDSKVRETRDNAGSMEADIDINIFYNFSIFDASSTHDLMRQSIEDITSEGKLGGYRVTLMEGVFTIGKPKLGGSQPELVYTSGTIHLERPFQDSFSNLSRDETKDFASKIDTELRQIFSGSVDLFQFLGVSMFRAKDDEQTAVDVIFAVLGLQDEFNKFVTLKETENGIYASLADAKLGTFRIKYAGDDPTLEVQDSYQFYTEMKATLLLKVKYNVFYDDLNSDQAQSLIGPIEEEINAYLATIVNDFIFVTVINLWETITVIPRTDDRTVGVDFVIGMQPYRMDLDPSMKTAFGEAVKDGKVGEFDVDSSVTESVSFTAPTRGFAITKATVDLKQMFLEDFNDLASPKRKVLVSLLEFELDYCLTTHVNGFVSATIEYLSDNFGQTTVHMDVTTTYQLPYFNLDVSKQEIAMALAIAIGDGKLGGFKLDSYKTKTVQICQPKLDSVYTPASLMLEENFDYDFNELTHTKTIDLINAVEQELNESLFAEIYEYKSVNVIKIRNVNGKTMLDLNVTTTGNADGSIDVTELMGYIHLGLQAAVDDGVLGQDSHTYNAKAHGGVVTQKEAEIGKATFTTRLDFIHEFSDQFAPNSPVANLLETALHNEIFSPLADDIKGFEGADVSFIDENGRVVVVIVLTIAIDPVKQWPVEGPKLREQLEELFELYIADGNIGGYDVDRFGGDSFSVRHPIIGEGPEEYIYTRTEFSLTHNFQRGYHDLKSNAAKPFIRNIKTSSDRALLRLESFAFAQVSRIWEGSTNVEANIATRQTKIGFHPDLLQQGIESAFKDATSNGKFGDMTLSKDFEVHLPEKDTDMLVYIYTRVELLLANDFMLRHTNFNHANTKLLIETVDEEMEKLLKAKLNNFVSVDIRNIRNDEGHASVHFEIVTKATNKNWNIAQVKDDVTAIMDTLVEEGEIGNEVDGNYELDETKPTTVHNPVLGHAYALEKFIYTTGTITIVWTYRGTFDDINSEESQQLLSTVNPELRQALKAVDKFEFATVVSLYNNGNTTVGFVIVSVSNQNSIDLLKLRSDIEVALQETVRDKQLGAYAVLDNAFTIELASYIESNPKFDAGSRSDKNDETVVLVETKAKGLAANLTVAVSIFGCMFFVLLVIIVIGAIFKLKETEGEAHDSESEEGNEAAENEPHKEPGESDGLLKPPTSEDGSSAVLKTGEDLKEGDDGFVTGVSSVTAIKVSGELVEGDRPAE